MSAQAVNAHIVDDYRILEQIGQGVFSIVYRAEHMRSKTIVALKEIRKDISPKDQILVENEVEILRRCQHPNIIKLLRDFRFKNRKYLAFEYCSRGDLNKLLREQGTFHESTVQMITYCICSALGELHRNNTVHRDLKLANILLTEEFVVKLADFGFSKQSEEQLMKTYCGTPITMPPEILDHQSYRKENCDTWSLGIICYQMLYGQPPWMPEEMGLVSLAQCIKQKPLRFNEHVEVSAECKRFLTRCLDKNMSSRPTIRELLQDQWLVGGQQQMQISKSAFEQEQQLMDSFELPELVSQRSLQAATSEEWAADDVFKLAAEEAFLRELKRLMLSNPKTTMKRVEELFANQELQLLLPLVWLQQIKALMAQSIELVLPSKSIQLSIADCKELEKVQAAVLANVKKQLDFTKAQALGKLNLTEALTIVVMRLMIDMLTNDQPVQLLQEKFDVLMGLSDVLEHTPERLVVAISVNSELDDFEKEDLLGELEHASKAHVLGKLNDGMKRKQPEEALRNKFTLQYSSAIDSRSAQCQLRQLRYMIAENSKVYKRQ